MTKKKNTLYRIILQIIIWIVAILFLFPVLYQVIASFKDRSEINNPLSFPASFYMGNYIEAFIEGGFFTLLKNSALVAFFTLLIVVLCGALAAYVIARSSGRFYKIIYFYFLSGIMIPFQAGMIPLYKLINSIGLTDSIWALILIQAGTAIPMSILIYSGFIRAIPQQLEEAAMIDGCSTVKAFFKIVFPLLKPATISTIIINIIPIWNDFLTPLIFISSQDERTLPIGMYTFMGERTADMGPIFAFSVLVCIIPVTLFLFMQKYFYKGIAAGAVKG